MDLTDYYRLDWTYTPADFLEAPLEITEPSYELKFADGKGHANIEPAAYLGDHSKRTQLHQEVLARFLAVQALTHKRFTLSNSQVNHIQPGGKSTIAFIEGTVAMTIECAGQLDLIQKDAAGNIIRDSKAERIQMTAEIMGLAAKHAPKDDTVDAILRSYSAAVNDRANELIHLYEVSEAIAKKFGGQYKAQAQLNFPKSGWSRLGKLANEEPLTQGRHRGQMVGKLRDAQKHELAEAREIARDLVTRYLKHLG